MKIYTSDSDAKFVQSIASASTLISSITGEVREYIISKFPYNFFKSIYVDTTETIATQNTNSKFNQNLNKLPYPRLSFSPEISLDDPIEGMEKGEHLSSPNLFLRTDMKGTYKKILVDPDQKYSLYFTSDYITTNFNFKIVVNKFIQNINLAHYIKSNFQLGKFQYLNSKYLNTEIPKTFIKMIAELLEYDINNPTDMQDLENYLIATGKQDGIITKKTNLATGKECFFVNEKVNFLILVTDLDVPANAIRDNMAEGEYEITFRVQVHAWLANAFIFAIDRIKLGLVTPVVPAEELLDEGFYSVSLTLPSLLMNNKEATRFIGSNGQEQIGQQIYHAIYTFPITLESQEIYLTDYILDDFLLAHAYMVSKNLDTRDLIYVEIYDRDGQVVLQVLDDPNSIVSANGDISYENLLINLNLSKARDFSLTIYGNRAIYETIREAMNTDIFFFKMNALSIIYLNINGVTVPVPVYAFENDAQMNTVTDDTALRVNTIYGPGYIGLVPIDDTLATDYRILLGYTAGGQEIVRAIEATDIIGLV